MLYHQRRMSRNPYLVVSVVDPRNLPDDIMEIVENKVSNGQESIEELKQKIRNKTSRREKVQFLMRAGDIMIAQTNKDLNMAKKYEKDKVENLQNKLQRFETTKAKFNNELQILGAEIEELEQQVEMQHMHRKLFQKNT